MTAPLLILLGIVAVAAGLLIGLSIVRINKGDDE